MKLAVFVGVLAAGCSTGGGGGGGATDATVEAAAKKKGAVGATCTADTDCATGHCFVNQWAPSGWCGQECSADLVREPCPLDPDGNPGGLCVQMSPGFKDTPNRFCLPACDKIYDCNGLAPFWETCEVPTWEGNPIFGPEFETRVCGAPSAQGKDKVDPVTCKGWDTIYGEGKPTQVSVCRAYCDYLVKCKEVVDPAVYNQECCAYGCLLDMLTPEGDIKVTVEKKRKCYVQEFTHGAKVCHAHDEDPVCPDKPDDTRAHP